MSLDLIHWYIVDTDKATIVRCGTVQAAHIDSIQTEPGQILRQGAHAHPLAHWEKDGHIIPYTPGQIAKRREFPGRGYAWRASTMGWEDRRPVAWAKEDKVVALKKEHERRRTKPVTVDGFTFAVTQENLHRVGYAVQGLPNSFRPNDLRWRDENGTMRTWATGAAYQTFARNWAAAVSQQFTDTDKWKDDLLDQINAAQFNAQIDAITW